MTDSDKRKLRSLYEGFRMIRWWSKGLCIGCGERPHYGSICHRCYYSEKHVKVCQEGLNASRYKSGQRTFIWCPHCNFELISGGSFVYDEPHGVYFRCRNCHRASLWNFDCPAPFTVAA